MTMPTTPVSPLSQRPDDARVAARESGPAARDASAQVLDSQALLQGLASVAIRHHGVVYRLQATRLGKLILTK